MFVSPGTGQPLRPHEMATLVMSDLQDKVSQCSVAVESAGTNGPTSWSHAFGLMADSMIVLKLKEMLPFRHMSIAEILDSFPSSKRWLHGTAASLKAACEESKRLIGLLGNLAVCVGVTSSLLCCQ